MTSTPTGSPSRRPRLQYPQPHGSSSSSLGGMEKAIPSFQSFSNSSIKYVDKPLPPVPARPSSDYSQQGEIIETYTKIDRKSVVSSTPSIYVQSPSYRSSTSHLPPPVPPKQFYKQHRHHSSASLRTRDKNAGLTLDLSNDTKVHNEGHSTGSPENSASYANSKNEGNIGKIHIADQQSDQYKELLPSQSRAPTPPGFKAFPYDPTLELHPNMDPIEFDYELVPPPLTLRTSPDSENPTSHFSVNSDDDDDDRHSVTRDSFLSHFRLKPSSLDSRPSPKDSRKPPSSLVKEKASSSNTLESPTKRTKRFSSLAKEKSNNLRNTFLSMYPKYSKHLSGSKTSEGRPLRIIPSVERTMGGPDTPHPATTPTSPPTGKTKAFSVIQGHNVQIRTVLDTATLGITRNKSEKKRRALKKSITVVGKADPIGDVKDHEWL
ncbi:MAG: hypothetical protein M1812_002901 [Candelaria pacifica]|nr:MAG: hypothetical protein M1812_002901 [Candelaria pacifica]